MNLFIMLVNQLKGKNILTITNFKLPKSDKFFKDGMFNLKIKNLLQVILKLMYIKIYLMIVVTIQEYMVFHL